MTINDKKQFKGVGGWLLLYLIGQLVLPFVVIVNLVMGFVVWPVESSGFFDRVFSTGGMVLLLLVSLLVFIPYSILRKGRPWVPVFHIVLNSVSALAMLVYIAPLGTLISALWVGYWARSERVNNTYRLPTAIEKSILEGEAE